MICDYTVFFLRFHTTPEGWMQTFQFDSAGWLTISFRPIGFHDSDQNRYIEEPLETTAILTMATLSAGR